MTAEWQAREEGGVLGGRVAAATGPSIGAATGGPGASSGHIEAEGSRERELRALLRDLHEQLLRRDEEIERLVRLLAALGRPTGQVDDPQPLRIRQAMLEATLDERAAVILQLEAERQTLQAALAEQRLADIRALQCELRAARRTIAEMRATLAWRLREWLRWASRRAGLTRLLGR